jgi:hypothetical protein
MANVVQLASMDDHGVVVELQLPLSSRRLDCMFTGRNEADKAPGVLRGPSGANLTPAQISRGVMLAGEVSRELAAEMKRRCKKG